MTLQQMKYIQTVVEKGSLNQAAKALFIAQPSLTTAIKEVEKEMGLQIFNRTNKGVELTREGDAFLGHIRQVLEQNALLEEKYLYKTGHRQRFSVSTQHYSFAVKAFVDVIQQFKGDKYDFTLRETQTREIIEDVASLRSELGVLYLSKANRQVIAKEIKREGLCFTPLFEAKPHVFISANHPLAKETQLTLEDLTPYPYLSFEQGKYNSFYYAEEILSTLDRDKNVKVRDRATLFNLVIGLNGYTVSSGVIDEELNGPGIIAKPLASEETMTIGLITHQKGRLSPYGQAYLEAVKAAID